MYREIPLSNETKSFFFILQLLANASCSCNLRRIRMNTFVKLSNRIMYGKVLYESILDRVV